jgi:acetoin utilization protein AcuA
LTGETKPQPLAVEPAGELLEDFTVERAGREIFFRRRVPASRLEQMQVSPGLGIFFRYDVERQKQTLIKIARMDYGNIVIAHTSQDEIVGYVTAHPVSPEERWAVLNQPSDINPEGKLYVCEFGAVEVSRQYRGWGLSTRLMRATFESDSWYASKIVVSVEFAWHWDYEEAGLNKFVYRKMLRKVISSAGFEAMDTDEPNILMDPANMFMVRLGKEVPWQVQQRFFSLLHKDNRWGF